jgi:hypothetical protein
MQPPAAPAVHFLTSRDQRFFPQRVAAQAHHQRHQVALFQDRARDQLGGGVRRVVDVGVGQQQKFSRQAERIDRLDTLRLRPYLARPAPRQRLGAQDAQAVFAVELARRGKCGGGGAVGAVVVHDDDVEGPWIVLRQQRAERACDDVGFIAGRDHGDQRRPGVGLADGPDGARGKRRHGPRMPEAAAGEQQHEPDQQR